MANPTFGEKKANTDYVARYGVYAVIPDAEKKQIVLVQAPNGAWFLPGGEIEAGENHQEALKRELIEELGFTAEIGAYYGQADEYKTVATRSDKSCGRVADKFGLRA